MRKDFLIAVITSPEHWQGEEQCLEELLQAGVEKLHIRKPHGGREALLERLAPEWSSRLVLHGGKDVLDTAIHYGIPQVHGHWHKPWEMTAGPSPSEDHVPGVGLSASLHSWNEVREVPPGKLEYVFLSPLFDSISKPGYMAGAGLLQRPAGVAPCRLLGLGGIDEHTIGQVMAHGWDGVAVLGFLWKKPEMALERFKLLKAIVTDHGR